MHPSMQRTWERDDVVEDLQTALDVVEQLEPPEDLRLQTYTYAVQLLTQRAMRSAGVVLGGDTPIR